MTKPNPNARIKRHPEELRKAVIYAVLVQGEKRRTVAKQHGLPRNTVIRWCYHSNKDRRASAHIVRPEPEDIAKRMAEARRMRQAAPLHDPNFVLLGEPLPGRSALAMKRATAPAAPVKNISLASCVADTSNLWNEHA